MVIANPPLVKRRNHDTLYGQPFMQLIEVLPMPWKMSCKRYYVYGLICKCINSQIYR